MKNNKSSKLSITLPKELLDYADSRKQAHGGSLSGYLQYLVKNEMSGKLGDETHLEDSRVVAIEAWGRKALENTKEPFIAVKAGEGVVSALSFLEGEVLWSQIAKWSAGWAKAHLHHLWIILPDSCSESDLVNYSVLEKRGIFPSVKPVRLDDFKAAASQAR